MPHPSRAPRSRRPSRAEGSLPSPTDCGLPTHFASWRKGQEAAVTHLLESPKPLSVLNSPTGAGKSACYVAWGELAGYPRVVNLVSTRALQEQLLGDFPHLVNIWGMGNYACELLYDRSRYPMPPASSPVPGHMGCDKGPCRGGEKCSLKMGGCRYYDALRVAMTSKRVVTNYSYWLHSLNYADAPLGDFDAMVMDEAHNAPEEVSRFLRTRISIEEAHARGIPIPGSLWKHMGLGEVDPWRKWADKAIDSLPTEEGNGPDVVRRIRDMKGKLSRLSQMPDDSVVDSETIRGRPEAMVCEPLWPRAMTREQLFGGTPRIVLSSATVRPKTLDLLGIPPDQYDWYNQRSPFHTARRPVHYCPNRPQVRVRHGVDLGPIIRRMDSFIEPRLDRKGIVHSVSYGRAREIRDRSQHKAHMLIHDSRNARQVIESFKRMPAPAILVSPSVTTGYDFPDSDARWQVLPKVPFPDISSPLTQARMEQDKDYLYYVTMTTVVQMVGRIVRGPGDWGESLILDDTWSWFRKAARDYAPEWFWAAESWEDRLPAPMEV